MKALRHEAPGVAETAKRLGVSVAKDALGYVFKTVHLQHGGKLSLTRAAGRPSGRRRDSSVLVRRARPGVGNPRRDGAHDNKRAAAEAGDTVALGKLDAFKTGDTLSSGKTAPQQLVQVAPSRRCWRWRSRPTTARTTSSSARPCCG